ncbi:MAG TPA: hypothetical protein DIW46_10305 [Microbacterium sp.]|nr:hypothetical protein [Microbacterium sp.]
MNIAAGWYPNPDDSTQLRYWDGAVWTMHFAPAAPAATVPIAATAPTVAIEPSPPAYVPPAIYAAPAAPTAAQGASTPASGSSTKKKWLIGGAIAAGVIVVGSIGAALGGAGRDEPAPVASAPPIEATNTPDPVVAPETPIPAPVSTPAPAPVVVDAVGFRAQAGSHLDDMNKDLDDLVTTVAEDGFFRLLSNSAELSFNLGQLDALDVPANVGVTWPESLTALEGALDILDDAITSQDGPTILAAVDTVRTQVEATRGVAGSAQ